MVLQNAPYNKELLEQIIEDAERKGVDPSSVEVTLVNRPLWQKFNEAPNEMIVTKSGR